MKLLRRHPWILSLALLLLFLLGWHWACVPQAAAPSAADSEYARLAGTAAQAASPAANAMPGPLQVAERGWQLLQHALERNGPNDVGIAWHLLYSLGRVLGGYLLALLLGVPLGFLLGLSALWRDALNPFIQILRPVSPLAWMPLALYTLKDSAASAIFIIFICSLWPLLINTAFGVAGVREDWRNVARVLDLPLAGRIRHIILPAALPMMLTGMRISIGTAWFVIVAAEMVAGQSGVGYFIWNEWNNLQIANMICALLLIGAVGLVLDSLLGALAQRLSFRE